MLKGDVPVKGSGFIEGGSWVTPRVGDGSIPIVVT